MTNFGKSAVAELLNGDKHRKPKFKLRHYLFFINRRVTAAYTPAYLARAAARSER